jgi:hypothetical protein
MVTNFGYLQLCQMFPNIFYAPIVTPSDPANICSDTQKYNIDKHKDRAKSMLVDAKNRE